MFNKFFWYVLATVRSCNFKNGGSKKIYTVQMYFHCAQWKSLCFVTAMNDGLINIMHDFRKIESIKKYQKQKMFPLPNYYFKKKIIFRKIEQILDIKKSNFSTFSWIYKLQQFPLNMFLIFSPTTMHQKGLVTQIFSPFKGKSQFF